MKGNWPRFSEYNAAFHHPETGLIPLELKHARVERNGFGSPDPLSGGFAYIYRLTLPDGSQKAVRVFIQEDPVRDVRIPWVLRRLEELKLKHPALQDVFLPCRWIDPCVHTVSGDVPALVMDWSAGQTLAEWLRKHQGDSGSIQNFREQFFRMMELLEKAGIAHGDLQVGNILVNQMGHPVLVDYDGVAFFDEDHPPPIQGGHPNFQHPYRPANLPSSQLDRFPAITIDLGLAAWCLFSGASWFLSLVADSDRLYFSRSDFLDPAHSEAFGRLVDHPVLATAARELEALCKANPETVPSLTEFRSRAFPSEVEAAGTEAPAITEEGMPSAAPAVQGFEDKDVQNAVPLSERGQKGEAKRGRKRPKWEEKETEYVPVFPLYSALDVEDLRGRVGEMIEVIGKITEIHEGETKYGDPYVFVNFMDWRESLVFHLVAWSEDLDELTNPPDEDWVGKWIQVTGLLEEPYVRKRYNRPWEEQVRYSIRLRQDHQFRFLSPQKARSRLRAAQKTTHLSVETLQISDRSSSPSISTFNSFVEGTSMSPSTPTSTSSSYFLSHSPVSLETDSRVPSNQELLKQLRNLASSSSSSNLPSGPGTGPSASSPLSKGQYPSTYGTNSKGKAPSDTDSKYPWILWLILIGLFLYLLSSVSR